MAKRAPTEPRTFKLGGRAFWAFQAVTVAAFVEIGISIYRLAQRPGALGAGWTRLAFLGAVVLLFQYVTLGVTGTLVIDDERVAVRRRFAKAAEWAWSEVTPRWLARRGMGGKPIKNWQVLLEGPGGRKRRRVVLTGASVEKSVEVRELLEAHLPKQA